MDTSLPLVTLIFLSYNNGRFLNESMTSLFGQSYANLQIIICDDCSTDDSVTKIESFIDNLDDCDQLKNLEFFINKTNQGIAESINKCMSLAKGELCIAFASDDVSSRDRVYRLVDFWLKNGKPSSIFSAVNLIDEVGGLCGEKHLSNEIFDIDKDLLVKNLIFRKSYVFGCSHAWTKEVFDKFGSLHKAVINEDKTIPLRSALLNGIKYIDEKLVDYRVGTGISAVTGDSYALKLYEHRRKSAIREYDDLIQNAEDLRLVGNDKGQLYVKQRLAEVELLLFLSKGPFVFRYALLKLFKTLSDGARWNKALKIFFDYFLFKIKRLFK